MMARYEEKNTVTIRRFEPRDLGGVLEVDAEVGGDHDPVLFTVFYESHPSTLLVAESEGQIIGVVVGFRQSPSEGRVFWLAVRPGHQGRGIGRRLITDLMVILRRLGVIKVILEARMGNQKAQSLYANMGFEMATACLDYYPDGEGAIIMTRFL
ncbi:MAG: GNAT family N-acetyltransferase [Methanothrix sp.]|nr:MAG: GNAT family N-acetyltransferase [Methanothrix sp.]